jgi:hypothetical protein
MKDTSMVKLIAHINRKNWWHVPPSDPLAYTKRGKFYASTFQEAEFWGRPLDTPEKVSIRNPLVGDEPTVQTILFGKQVDYPGDDDPNVLIWRWALDAKMKEAALARGFDSIVILSPCGFANLRQSGKLPRSIELNVLIPIQTQL